MPTISVSRANITQEELLTVLKDQLGGATIEAQGGNAVKVKTSVFSHAKVQILPSGTGTSFKIGPFAVGPVGYLVTMLGLAKRVAGAIESAPQFRASS